MKIQKIIGVLCLIAFVISLIPYRFKKDKETGAFEIRSLLWGLKKTPGEDKYYYTFAMPASGLGANEDKESEVSAEVLADPE